ncbi:MAG TPA: hypothetical protein VMU83_14385 [Hanamia sp.]|nr:hypothetical protein [Hanamia sp.]
MNHKNVLPDLKLINLTSGINIDLPSLIRFIEENKYWIFGLSFYDLKNEIELLFQSIMQNVLSGF